MDSNKNWRMALTKHKAEKKVCEQLAKRSIEYYYPCSKADKRTEENCSSFYHPFFERRIFVRVNNDELVGIKQIDGVQNFVYWLSEPALVYDSEIATLKSFLSGYQSIQLSTIPVLVGTQPSTFTFSSQHQYKTPGEECFKAFLPSLGLEIVAIVPKPRVEFINVALPKYKKAISGIFTGSFR